MLISPEHDHCHTAADVMASAMASQAFRRSLFDAAKKRVVAQERARSAAEYKATETAVREREIMLAAGKDRLEAFRQPERLFLTSRRVVSMACKILGVKLLDLKSDRRTKPMPDYRHCISWCCRELTLNSLPHIGMELNRDHTTILYGIRRIDLEIESGGPLGRIAVDLRGEIMLRFVQERGAK